MSCVVPLNSARRPKGLWACGQRQNVDHKPHRPSNSNSSGQMMCYKARTSSRATDSTAKLASKTGRPMTEMGH
jgi:hypothetical protein